MADSVVVVAEVEATCVDHVSLAKVVVGSAVLNHTVVGLNV